jgi:hypothetical protein
MAGGGRGMGGGGPAMGGGGPSMAGGGRGMGGGGPSMGGGGRGMGGGGRGMGGGGRGTGGRSGGGEGENRTTATSLEQQVDDQDTEAYLNAELVLTEAQQLRAREIAEHYREQLWERREAARKRNTEDR